MRAAGALLAALSALAWQAGLAKLPEMLQARLGKENIEKIIVFYMVLGHPTSKTAILCGSGEGEVNFDL